MGESGTLAVRRVSFFSILLGVYLFSTPAKAGCASLFQQIAQAAVKNTALIGLTLVGAWAGSETVGISQGTPLIGLSIYFDFENILSYFSAEEQRVLLSPQKNLDQILPILNHRLAKLSGDAVKPWPYLNPVMASQYFGENPPPENMCRHKALILKALLARLGISSRLATGSVSADAGRGDHVWLVLPQVNKVADPMNDLWMNQADYNRLFEVQENYGIIHWARPVGVLAR